jgi:FAD/FMN-containing dehydrogenase
VNVTPSLPPLPGDFRGLVRRGEEARALAHRVSGPFRHTPTAWLEPADVASLILLVRWARDHRIPLIPRGAGTGMPGGNTGPFAIVSLDEGFSEVRIDAERGTVRAGAGAVAARVDDAARSLRRYLPFLPASARWCTVGGMVANNAAGAGSFLHGATARWVAAVEGIDADGGSFRVPPRPQEAGPQEEEEGMGTPGSFSQTAAALARGLQIPVDPAGTPVGWPSVRKNSSGYALDRFLPGVDPLQLLVGSEGTLALLTAVEFRTLALPEEEGLALLPAATAQDVVELARAAKEVGAAACEFLGRRFLELAGLAGGTGGSTGSGPRAVASPRVMELARSSEALLLVQVDGSAEEVEHGLDELRRLGGRVAGEGIQTRSPEERDRLWALRKAASPTIARQAERGLVSTQFIEDCVVPVQVLDTYLMELDRILSQAGFQAAVFGHAGDGNVHVNPLVDVRSRDWLPRVRFVLEAVVDLVAALGGTLAGEHGDGRLRAPFLHRIWGDRFSEAFRTIKAELDPEGILNPGVIVPIPGQDPLDGLAPQRRTHP